MKKSIKFLALALALSQTAVFTSCSSNEDSPSNPKVQTVASHMSIATDPVQIYIQIDQAPASNVTVPFHCSGDAVQGTDYTLSASQFVIKAGETSAYVTLSRNDNNISEDNKTLTLNLDNGTGYELGLSNYTQVTLLGTNGYVISFVDTELKLVEEAEVTVEVLDMSGDYYNSEIAETFQVEVDELNSTAVEGEHFSFPDGKSFTVAAHASKGSFKIKAIKAEEGKDKIVLRLADKAGFATGVNPTMTVTVAGYDNFSGTWAYKEFVNIELFQMYGMSTDELPTATSSEQIVLTGDTENGYTLETHFTGGFKNYFVDGSHQMTYEGQVSKLFQDVYPYTWPFVYSFNVTNINVKFSASASDVKDAKIGLRLVQSDGQEVLEMTIDDYNPPTDTYWGEILSWMDGMEGLTGGEWMPVRLYFSRVK